MSQALLLNHKTSVFTTMAPLLHNLLSHWHLKNWICWVIWLCWCGIHMELRCGMAVVVWYPYGVTLWYGCGGVVSVLHTDTTPPQPYHNVTPTHIEPGMCKLRYMTSEYIQETLSKIYYTLRTLYNHKTPQQPIFAETQFLKQPHMSRLNTPH